MVIKRANTRFAPTIRVLNDVAQTIHELSVRDRRLGFVRSAKWENVGAILVIALMLMRQFVNCLYGGGGV